MMRVFTSTLLRDRLSLFFITICRASHTSHHLLAVFALGAPVASFDTIFNVHVDRTRPALKSPGNISKENFYEHLGKKSYYDSYLHYFHNVILEKGATAAIEEYVFARGANVDENGSDKSPRKMFNRLFARLYHPMIYIGYGLEFGIPGLVAEGLAQTAVHSPEVPSLIPSSLFESQDGSGDSVTRLTSRLSTLLMNTTLGKTAPTGITAGQQPVSGVHAFTVLARILQDDAFTASSLGLAPLANPADNPLHYSKVAELVSQKILAHAEDWIVDGSNDEELQSKIEELCWMNALLYGVGGWSGRKDAINGKFIADFFMMHMVTSSLFLCSFVPYLSPSSTVLLLRTYFLTSLTWWISRGRPPLPIREFYESVSDTPVIQGIDDVKPSKSTLSPETVTPNPWLQIIQMSIVHTDDHLCKIQRALAHFARQYGERPAGHFAASTRVGDATLDGVELLDGTLFLKIASLTAEKVAAVKEAHDPFYWDLKGFYL